MADATVFNFTPGGLQLRNFMVSEAFVRGIRGPWGSGKSAGCCVEMFRRAMEQGPAPDGVRRTRWAVIRNTGPQLRTTTIKTWLQWFPEHVFGKFKYSPPLQHLVKVGPLPDGTHVEMDVYFMALDDAADVENLYSLELTGGWVNEARFVPKEAIDALTGRVGRYPAMKDGGPTWRGVIMDTNAPAEDHWWAVVSGDKPPPEHWTDEDRLTMEKPAEWEFYTQPPGMLETFDEKGNLAGYRANPDAENVAHLPPQYYEKTIQGKPRQWIEVNILNRYGNDFEGRKVYPSYAPETHAATEELRPLPLPVHVGLDFGRTPAAVFGQRRGAEWFMLYELVTSDMSIKTFAGVLRTFLAEKFPGVKEVHVYGDPSGSAMAQTEDETPFSVLRANGIVAYPTFTNDFDVRREAVEEVLTRMVDGRPSFKVSPKCQMLRAAMEGGYHFRRLKIGGQEIYAREPTKNRYSHVAEALQYLLLGAGEGRRVLTGGRELKPVVAPRSGGVFARNASRFRGLRAHG